MSAPRQFQLFPPPPTQHKRSNGSRKRAGSQTHATTPQGSSPTASTEETKASTQAEAVILQIIEDTNTAIPYHAGSPTDISRGVSGAEGSKMSGHTQQNMDPEQKPPPRAIGPCPQPSLADSNRRVWPAEAPSQSLLPSSHIPAGSVQQPHEVQYSAGMRSAAPSSTPPTTAPMETVASSASQATSETPTTSIFPRYDPSLPLSKQRYYPQLYRALPNLPPDAVSRTERKVVTTHGASETFPAQTYITADGSTLASTEELVHLWDAANGQGSQGSIGTVKLRLRRIDALTYTLGNRSVPLYTLKTNRMNDIEIHRTHPGKPNTKAPVVTLSLGEIDQSISENVSITLFPKLAEIFAREQALELSRRNQLDPPHAMQAANDAVKRAEAQEACVLRWNPAYSRYDLYHHALTGGCGSQESHRSNLQPNDSQGMLGLTITSSATPHGSSIQARPNILITGAQQSHWQPSATQPGFGDDISLMALDLNTMVLSISTDSILSASPSLYIVDALIASILTVAVFDDASSLVLRDMAIDGPTPEDFPNPYRAPTSILETGSATPNNNPGSNTANSTHGRAPSGSITTNQAKKIEVTGAAEVGEEGEGNRQEAALMAQIRSEQRSRCTYSSSSMTRHKWRFSRSWRRVKLTLLSWRGAMPDENISARPKERKTPEGRRKNRTSSSAASETSSVAEIDLERNAPMFGRPLPPTSCAGDEEKTPVAQGPERPESNSVARGFRALLSLLRMILGFIMWLLTQLGRCMTRRRS